MFKSWLVTVEVLTGLHIRAGNLALKAGWDFVVDRGRAFVLNVDAVYEGLWPGGVKIPTPADLLRGRDPAPFARYTLELAGGQPPAELWPVVREPVDGRPFIPGSSLKGLIRTALAWHLYQGPLNRYPGGSNPRQAAKGLEAELFGREPHHDLLRVMRVSDLRLKTECRQWAAPVELYSVGRHGRLESAPGRDPGVVELVGAGAIFSGEVSLDTNLLGRARELRLRPAVTGVLPNWPEVLRGFGRSLLSAQVAFFRQRGLPDTAKLLAELDHYDGIVACLGWGAGWPGKTVGLKLQPAEVEEVARRYNQTRWRSPHFPDLFPISRRLARLPQGLVPLGWLGIKVKVGGR